MLRTAAGRTELVDGHGRVVNDLRVSVTPRCNLRCTYCDPMGLGHDESPGTLTTEAFAVVLEAASRLGMRSVRFTGGEPLLRKDLPELVRLATSLPGVEDGTVTTNATALEQRQPALLASGWGRVYVRLHAYDPV